MAATRIALAYGEQMSSVAWYCFIRRINIRGFLSTRGPNYRDNQKAWVAMVARDIFDGITAASRSSSRGVSRELSA